MIADRYGMPMELEASSHGGRNIGQRKLMRWYERFGFVPTGEKSSEGNPYMRRERGTMTESVQWSNRATHGDVIVWVDAKKVEASWAKDRYSWFDSNEHPNAIKGRLPRFDDWIKRGQPVNPPEIALTDAGEIFFTNGRHRFVWMLQHGQTCIPAAVRAQDVSTVEKLFGCKP